VVLLLIVLASYTLAKADRVRIKLSETHVKQGQTFEVRVWVDDPLLPETCRPTSIRFNGQTARLFPDPSDASGNSWRALLAAPADLKPGIYSVSSAGAAEEMTVASGRFPVQHLRLPKSKDSFIPSPGEREAIDRAKESLSAVRLWQGPFLRPCEGRLSASFGMRRVVNGRLLNDYFHTGVDYAASQGTRVMAPAPGRVVLARTGWRLNGNTVVIDHGQSVVTIYIHLQKVLVQEGQEVKGGDVIGAVGNTGRCSGPHLHFGLYVNNVATDPEAWFKGSF